MFAFRKLSNTANFLINLVLLEVLWFGLLRLIFFIAFNQDGDTSIAQAFWVGFRFDVQLAVLLSLPIWMFSGIKHIGLFKGGKLFWLVYLWFANIVVMAIYVANFAHFDFFKKNIDATVLRFFYDLKDATKMMTEGYPLWQIIVAFVLFSILCWWALRKIFQIAAAKEVKHKESRWLYLAFVVVYLFAAYGKFEFYPWRWSEAFYSSDKFSSYLASNPVTYFVNTLKNSGVKYDRVKAEKYYGVVADFLGAEKTKDLSLARQVQPLHANEYTFDNPNIVYILGESTSYARTSMSGNPLNPTPFLQKMADEGISFSRYYTPHAGTARSVWVSLTGLTDVEQIKTSSRNPMVVNQRMMLNDLQGYNKFYFIGGSLSWGNVRGVISNVDGIQTFEESDYQTYDESDVWGVSDVHLVGEVNQVLKKQKKPFFAIVQLAGNHSPNHIPKDNHGFVFSKDVSEKKLKNYGFDGKLDELNGQRFLDHSVARLIGLAKQEDYFDNTIFVFVGDHGLSRKATHVHQAEQVFGTATLHTPLIIYAPKLIKPKKISYPVSAVDAMATMVALTGQKYTNTTMGRDLLAKDFEQQAHYASFISHADIPTINLMNDEFIFKMKADGTAKQLQRYFFKKKDVDLLAQYPEVAAQMESVVRGLYEMTRYVRYHNGKEKRGAPLQ